MTRPRDQHPALAALDAYWRTEENVLFSGLAGHVEAIDACIARIDAVREGRP